MKRHKKTKGFFCELRNFSQKKSLQRLLTTAGGSEWYGDIYVFVTRLPQ